MIEELIPVVGEYQSYLIAGYPVSRIHEILSATTYEQSTQK